MAAAMAAGFGCGKQPTIDQAKASLASKIELSSIDFDVTEPMGPSVAVVVGPDQVEVSEVAIRVTWARQIEQFRHRAQREDGWYDGWSETRQLRGTFVKNPDDQHDGADPISLADGRFPDDNHEGGDPDRLLISPVYDQLRQTGHKDQILAKLMDGEPSKSVVIAADKNAALSTIVEILYTSGQAGYQHFTFLVRAPDGHVATLPLYTPMLGAPVDGQTDDLRLMNPCAAVQVDYVSDGLVIGLDRSREYELEALNSARAKLQGAGSIDEILQLDRLHRRANQPPVGILEIDGQTAQKAEPTDVDADSDRPDPDRSDLDTPAKPAWDGATLVGADQQCPSVALNDPTAVGRDLYTLVGVFDSFRVCRSARFNIPTLPGPGRTVESAQQATAGLLAADTIDGVTWMLPIDHTAKHCHDTYRPDQE